MEELISLGFRNVPPDACGVHKTVGPMSRRFRKRPYLVKFVSSYMWILSSVIWSFLLYAHQTGQRITKPWPSSVTSAAIFIHLYFFPNFCFSAPTISLLPLQCISWRSFSHHPFVFSPPGNMKLYSLRIVLYMLQLVSLLLLDGIVINPPI